jgi:hypothetical protein
MVASYTDLELYRLHNIAIDLKISALLVLVCAGRILVIAGWDKNNPFAPLRIMAGIRQNLLENFKRHAVSNLINLGSECYF